MMSSHALSLVTALREIDLLVLSLFIRPLIPSWDLFS